MRRQFLDLLADIGFLGSGLTDRQDRKGRNRNAREMREALYRYSSHAGDLELLRAVLAAGMYPNVVLVQQKKNRAMFRTREDGKVDLHPASVNAKEKYFPSAWLVYNDKVKSSGIFVRASTMVSDYALLLFGGQDRDVRRRQRVDAVRLRPVHRPAGHHRAGARAPAPARPPAAREGRCGVASSATAAKKWARGAHAGSGVMWVGAGRGTGRRAGAAVAAKGFYGAPHRPPPAPGRPGARAGAAGAAWVSEAPRIGRPPAGALRVRPAHHRGAALTRGRRRPGASRASALAAPRPGASRPGRRAAAAAGTRTAAATGAASSSRTRRRWPACSGSCRRRPRPR